MHLEVLKYAFARTQEHEASWVLFAIAFYFPPTQQLQMVLVNRTGTFPLTLAKFMSTAQTTTVCLESPNLLLHGEHTSALHLLFPVHHGITCLSCFSFGLLWTPKPPCSAISFGVDELLSDGAASPSPPPPPPPAFSTSG